MKKSNENFRILAYYLAREGYNVFLANVRGNFYSKYHENGDEFRKSSEYWDFSWDTIGYKDIPTIIDYVRTYTGAAKVYIIAHSQATSSLMALLSKTSDYELYKNYNDRIYAIAFLSPVGYMGSATMHIATLLAKIRGDAMVMMISK